MAYIPFTIAREKSSIHSITLKTCVTESVNPMKMENSSFDKATTWDVLIRPSPTERAITQH